MTNWNRDCTHLGNSTNNFKEVRYYCYAQFTYVPTCIGCYKHEVKNKKPYTGKPVQEEDYTSWDDPPMGAPYHD